VNSLGKLLISAGGLLILVGLIVVVAGRANIPLGRLPGDISYREKNTAVFFPITTSIIISIVLSFIFWLVNRFMR
jgi:ribose/xylose/arabinose/galactoside ABC-type transport system permease subunit